MANFKNNYSELLLLANKNIKFWDGEKSFELVPMTLNDMLFNEPLVYILSLLETDIDEIKKDISGIEIKSHYEFIHLILSLGSQKEEVSRMSRDLLLGLKVLIPGINFDKKVLEVNGVFIDSLLFGQIVEIIFKVLDKKVIIIFDTDDEFTVMEKKAMIRAERIKNNSKKREKQTDSSLKDNMVALVYEYPQYKLEDLFNLNIYAFNYLFKYVGKIANYEVSKIAAGNGLAKKHKYFIEK